MWFFNIYFIILIFLLFDRFKFVLVNQSLLEQKNDGDCPCQFEMESPRRRVVPETDDSALLLKIEGSRNLNQKGPLGTSGAVPYHDTQVRHPFLKSSKIDRRWFRHHYHKHIHLGFFVLGRSEFRESRMSFVSLSSASSHRSPLPSLFFFSLFFREATLVACTIPSLSPGAFSSLS
jgi:hypothetical protein